MSSPLHDLILTRFTPAKTDEAKYGRMLSSRFHSDRSEELAKDAYRLLDFRRNKDGSVELATALGLSTLLRFLSLDRSEDEEGSPCSVVMAASLEAKTDEGLRKWLAEVAFLWKSCEQSRLEFYAKFPELDDEPGSEEPLVGICGAVLASLLEARLSDLKSPHQDSWSEFIAVTILTSGGMMALLSDDPEESPNDAQEYMHGLMKSIMQKVREDGNPSEYTLRVFLASHFTEWPELPEEKVEELIHFGQNHIQMIAEIVKRRFLQKMEELASEAA